MAQLTLTFTTSGTDAFRTGSVFESRAANVLTFVTSVALNNTLTITPANAITNHVSIGSYIYFSCTEAGLWNVNYDLAKDTAAVKGAAAWSTV